MRNNLLRLTAIAATICVALSVGALAHSGATGVVKQRMDRMSDIAASMKALTLMSRGQALFDRITARVEAMSIAAHGESLMALFPEGSTQTPSEAAERIWSERAEFDELLARMTREALELSSRSQTLRDETDLIADLKSLGETCSACHARFRIKR